VRDDAGVVFVEDVIPGERVRYALAGRRGGARRGRLLTVLEPSPSRVTPSCARAGRCGGCDWLHLDRAAQTAGKEQIVDDALVRIGRLDPVLVAAVRAPLVVPADSADGARRRVRLAVDNEGRTGFFARGSHDIVAVDACPALDARLQEVQRQLPRLSPRTTLRLAVDDEGQVVAAVERPRDARALVASGLVAGAVVVQEAVDDVVVGEALLHGEVTAGLYAARSDAACFTQATRGGGRAIVDAVVEASDAVLGGVQGRRVLELFAGSGHLTLPLLARGATVDAVEGDGRGVRFLRDNVRRLSPAAGAVVVRQAFIDGRLPLGEPAPDLVVADPPRTGVPGAAVLWSRLVQAGVGGLVLVSCDPATGARDLRAAVDAGFVLRRVVPIDAFPHTHHVEWVAALQRGGTVTTATA
jgi:23S rRNA (uracil1939-C5)-methyltransferase